LTDFGRGKWWSRSSDLRVNDIDILTFPFPNSLAIPTRDFIFTKVFFFFFTETMMITNQQSYFNSVFIVVFWCSMNNCLPSVSLDFHNNPQLLNWKLNVLIYSLHWAHAWNARECQRSYSFLCICVLSRSVMSDSLRSHRL